MKGITVNSKNIVSIIDKFKRDSKRLSPLENFIMPTTSFIELATMVGWSKSDIDRIIKKYESKL